MWTRAQIEAGANALADWLEQHANPIITKLLDGQNPSEVLTADSKAGPVMQALGFVDETLIAVEDAGHHAHTIGDLYIAFETWKGISARSLDVGTPEGAALIAERDKTMG